MVTHNAFARRLARQSLAAAAGVALITAAAQAATFQVTSLADSGAGSLRQAMEDANNDVDPATIDFSPIAGGTITLEAGLPVISNDVVLQGSDVILDGAGRFTCLAAENADLGVDSMTITHCAGQFLSATSDNGIENIVRSGGAIRVDSGNLELSNSIISNNAAPQDTASEQFTLTGGGIFLTQAGDVSITNSTIRENSADEAAGGIHVEGASQSVTVSDSVIVGNISGEAHGGALLSAGGDIILSAVTVTDNEGVAGAGGLEARSTEGAIEFSNSAVLGNHSAAATGGANFRTEGLGNIVMTDLIIANNTSEEGDGGLFARAQGQEGASGSVRIADSVISSNTANGTLESGPAGGGTLRSEHAEVEVTDTIVVENVGRSWALGGLAVSAYLGSSIERSAFIGNSSEEGTGGLLGLGGLSLNESTIADNSGAGGGLMHFDFSFGPSPAVLEVRNSTLSGNSASSVGGGALVHHEGPGNRHGNFEGDFVIEHSTISGNSADGGAGIVIGLHENAPENDTAPQAELAGVTITDNHATAGRGGGLQVAMESPNTVSLSGNIISGNSASDGGTDLAADGESGNVSFQVAVSLIGEAPDDGSGFDTDTLTGDLLGTDPLLDVLADNGGPTRTHLPAPDSPARKIVAAEDGCGGDWLSDQRGRSRPGGDNSLCDAGSVERQGQPRIAVDAEVDFGDMPVGDAADPVDALLENTGAEALEIASFSGPSAPFTLDFSHCGDALPFVLWPGENCSLSFGFQPASGSDFGQTVTLESNSDGGTSEIQLSGRGTVPGLSFVDLHFGNMPVGETGEAELTLSNDGDADLSISDLTLSGDAAFELIGDDCAGPIAPGGSCQVDIRFAPDAPEAFAAALAVASNASKAPVDVAIAGQGVVGKLVLSPSGGLDFGNVPVGETGEAELTLSNDGDAPMEITDWSDPGAPFAVTSDGCPEPPFTLAPGESCTLILMYAPLSYGDHEQALELAVNDGSGSGSLTVGVSGRGVRPNVPVPTLDRIGLIIGSGLLALLGLLGMRRRRDNQEPTAR